nr:putative protein 2 [Helicoverpa armigera]
MMGKITIMVVLCSLACVQGQFFEDRRCRCVCPSPASVLNISSTRQIFTGNVPPNKCHCEGVVIPLIGKEIEGKVHLLCPRCECSYQTRNTTLIMGVVFLMLTLIGMAVIYMITLLWLNTWVMSQRMETPIVAVEDGKGRTEEEDRLLLCEDPED